MMPGSAPDESQSDSSSKPEVKVLDGLPVEEYVKQERWHRKVVFYSEVARKEITASYAIAGSQDPSAKTFLYVGGLFGGRLHGLYADYTLAKAGVRGIFVDRPGLGFFTRTGIEQRIAVWYEAVPLILKDVGIDRVALVALSGGAPYVFNLCWQRPDLVHPEAPLFLLSPWIHPSKSAVRMHSWMSWMPATMTRGVSKVGTMVVQRLLSTAEAQMKPDGKVPWVGKQSNVLETCGAEAQVVSRHRAFFNKTIFDEDTSGSVEDYILGVKNPKSTWGIAADYADWAQQISTRFQSEGRTLRIQTFFAAHDVFIGDKGINYFIDTFSDPALHPGINFSCEVMEETDHEGVALPENGAIPKMIAVGLPD